MPDTCVDCRERPRLHDLGCSYTETFPVKTVTGSMVTVSLRLCLRCGSRFVDRMQLRDYLRAKVPQVAVEAAATPVQTRR